MSRGSGIIQRTNKVEPPAAATVTAARNGLSLVGTNVELGGANPLLHLTNVEHNFFEYTHTQLGSVLLSLAPGTGRYQMGDVSGGANGMKVDIDDTNNLILIGDTLAVFNGTLINIDDAGQAFSFQSNASNYILFDVATQLYQLGDISGVGNNTKIDIKDASQAIELDAGTSPARLTLVGTPAGESLVVDFAGSPYLSLNPNTGGYLLGDIASIGNGIVLDLEDSVQQASISSVGFSMLFLDMANGIFQLGASAGGSLNRSYFQIDDSTQQFTTVSSSQANGLLVSLTTPRVQLGDYAAIANSTFVDIADSLRSITMNAAFGVGINGAPTLSPFAVTGLQNFANNAAAVLAGLAIGDFYRISVAGTSAVAVVQ